MRVFNATYNNILIISWVYALLLVVSTIRKPQILLKSLKNLIT